MAENLSDTPDLATLGPALTRWTMGGAAASTAPATWATAIGDNPVDAELRLLALSSHFLGVFVAPAPTGLLRDLPEIPRLALPTIPARLRPLLRRILAGAPTLHQRHIIAGFLAARGLTLHPADWLPAANDAGLPDVYAPWLDWAAACAAGDTRQAASADALTAESWDDFGPAARAVRLGELRRHDPAAARALIAARLAGEDADARLRLVATLANGLGPDDRPLLESLSNDRAPRVKAQAAALLARLGTTDADPQDLTELAGFFELKSQGLLRRTRIVVAKPTKTQAQNQRRTLLLQAADFTAFATALALTPQDLATSWPFDRDPMLDMLFIGLAERSASDPVIDLLAQALAAAPVSNVPAMTSLRPRLSPDQRRSLASRALQTGGIHTLNVALDIAGPDPQLDDLAETPAFAALLKLLAEPKLPATIPELWALGWLAAPATARALHARLTATGLAAADPRLDTIRLNIMLDQGDPE